MWDPGIHFAEVRLAKLQGFQRRFNYKTTVGRGSPECPGLLLAIERQAGYCTGLAFRVAADKADNEAAIMWRREMVRGNYTPAWLPMTTPQGDILMRWYLLRTPSTRNTRGSCRWTKRPPSSPEPLDRWAATSVTWSNWHHSWRYWASKTHTLRSSCVMCKP